MYTVFAQSSKPGKAGVSLFRISGTNSLFALQQLLLGENVDKLIPRHIYYKKIYDQESLELIDSAMVVYFKGPNSFTGEDVVEIYTHGSVAIAKMLYSALLKITNLRIAEPGEFTKRAFLNNKFDLTSAEGLADLIEAETILQHRQAIRQMNGGLKILYDNWRQELLTSISLLEAYIDFPDEEIPKSVIDQVSYTLTSLKNTIHQYLNDNRRGELMRNGVKLAIIGEPNVGKSSLLNFLLQREIAIVSDIAGTTRDIIEAHLDIGGYPVILQDTAGIRSDTIDVIEQEGMVRAVKAAREADIKIVMLSVQNQNLPNIISDIIDENSIILLNKIDLIQTNEAEFDPVKTNHLAISLKENIGLNELMKEIENVVGRIAGSAEQPPITRERHRHQLRKSLEYLTNCDLTGDLVLAAEDIRMTMKTLAGITGIITVDEILGEIFSNFCIGK